MLKHKPVIIKNYVINITQEQVLKRLGYNKYKTKIDNKTYKLINELINESKILIQPIGTFKFVNISIQNKEITFIENNYKIQNSNLTNHILKNNGNSLILLSCTIGKNITDKIQSNLKNNFNEKAVILDAVASELVENNITYLEKICLRHYYKTGKKTNFRFSPGYGNVELKHQVLFEDLLKISNIGITTSESYMLIPEKSITAFLPFKKNENI